MKFIRYRIFENLYRYGFLLETQEPQDRFFLVSAVTPGVDPYRRQFASFAPPFDSEGRDTKNFGNLSYCEKIRPFIA